MFFGDVNELRILSMEKGKVRPASFLICLFNGGFTKGIYDQKATNRMIKALKI